MVFIFTHTNHDANTHFPNMIILFVVFVILFVGFDEDQIVTRSSKNKEKFFTTFFGGHSFYDQIIIGLKQ